MHTEISLDGRSDGFEINMGTYYRLAETFEPDATLSGSNTMLAAEMPDPVPEWCFEAAARYLSCSRMAMAIVDCSPMDALPGHGYRAGIELWVKNYLLSLSS